MKFTNVAVVALAAAVQVRQTEYDSSRLIRSTPCVFIGEIIANM